MATGASNESRNPVLPRRSKERSRTATPPTRSRRRSRARRPRNHAPSPGLGFEAKPRARRGSIRTTTRIGIRFTSGYARQQADRARLRSALRRRRPGADVVSPTGTSQARREHRPRRAPFDAEPRAEEPGVWRGVTAAQCGQQERTGARGASCAAAKSYADVRRSKLFCSARTRTASNCGVRLGRPGAAREAFRQKQGVPIVALRVDDGHALAGARLEIEQRAVPAARGAHDFPSNVATRWRGRHELPRCRALRGNCARLWRR